MDAQPLERRLAAILSADVAGYSRLMAADEEATVHTLSAYRQAIDQIVRQHRGRVVDSPGDNLLAEFPSALDATRCGVAIQEALRVRNAALPEHRCMKFRVGVHLGDVVAEGARIHGDGVNIAARLEGLTEPGGLCISGAVYEQVRDRLPVTWHDLGVQALKNIPHPVHLYGLGAGAADQDPTPVPGAEQLALRGLAGRRDVSVLVVPTLWVIYVAIGFEILFMVSPLGLYFYSIYGPTLNVLHRSPRTAWLTDFFLPHFSVTTNAVLNALPEVGGVLAVVGGILFGFGFVQIYGARLRGGGVVTGGLYRLTRHPQYVILAAIGLGCLLMWPRILVLIAYVTMLFLYGVLARWEEERCLNRYGARYRSYQQRTAGFLPRAIGARVADLLPTRGRAAAVVALYVLVLVASVGAAYRLRDYSLARVAAIYERDVAVLSPAPLSEDEIRTAWRVAGSEPRVDAAVGASGRGDALVIYVLPVDWELPDLPFPVPDDRHGGHYTPANFDRRLYKVLVTRARSWVHATTGPNIVRTAYGRDPIIIARVNLETGQVMAVETPPLHVEWGDISTPMF